MIAKYKKIKLKTFLNKKNLLLITMLSFYCCAITNVHCASFNTGEAPIPTLEDLILNLNVNELQQIDNEIDQIENGNANTNSFLRSVLLAIGVNLIIVGIAYYGPTVWEYLRDATQNIYRDTVDIIYHIGRAAVHNPTHVEVINRIAHLTPEHQQQIYTTAQTIIARRIG